MRLPTLAAYRCTVERRGSTIPASNRAIADCEVFIRLAMALCEMRERLRTAASASSSARRWRASSINEGNSEFFFVDSSTISSRKSCCIGLSFTFPDQLALLSLAVANLPVVVLLASGESSASAASFSESLLTPGVCGENGLRTQKVCGRPWCCRKHEPHRCLDAHGVLPMAHVRAHTPFPPGWQLGLHLATPEGNLLWVLLRSRFDSRATAFYMLAARSSSPTLFKIYHI